MTFRKDFFIEGLKFSVLFDSWIVRFASMFSAVFLVLCSTPKVAERGGLTILEGYEHVRRVGQTV